MSPTKTVDPTTYTPRLLIDDVPGFDPGDLAKWCANKRTLVVGLGGGADILLVSAISTLLTNGSTKPAKVMLGNTKGTRSYRHLKLLKGFAHIGRVDRHYHPSQRKLAKAHATVRLDALVRCADGRGPYIFKLPDEADPSGSREILEEIRRLKIEAIVAVDGGGDVLTEPWDRDGRMLGILEASDIPLRLLVVGPGCDGQSTYLELYYEMLERAADGECVGSFHLKPLLTKLQELSELLPKTKHKRVIQVILAAHARELKMDSATEWAIVPRETYPAIPWEWLTQVFVYDPSACRS